MGFWPVNRKNPVCGIKATGSTTDNCAELLDFLNAGDELHCLFSMLFGDSGCRKSQNDDDLFGREHVNTPFNGGPVDVAGSTFAEMRHAVMCVRRPLILNLNVLNCLAQFLV